MVAVTSPLTPAGARSPRRCCSSCLLRPWGGLKRLFGLYPAVRGAAGRYRDRRARRRADGGRRFQRRRRRPWRRPLPLATLAALRVLGTPTSAPRPSRSTRREPARPVAGTTAPRRRTPAPSDPGAALGRRDRAGVTRTAGPERRHASPAPRAYAAWVLGSKSRGSGVSTSGHTVRGEPSQRPREHALAPSARTTKHIFVTGGVASSLGKGLTASSLGSLLTARGSARGHAEARPLPQRRSRHDEPVPARRGLRHRGRRRDRPRRRALRALPRPGPVRQGQRHHRPDLLRRSSPRSGAASTSATPCRSSRTSPTRSRPGSGRWPTPDEDGRAPDVVITEVGGTVGDIESLPFLEAIRQVRHDIGRDNCFYLHVSLVPYLAPSRRAEDQADPALGRRAAQHRHPARRAGLPLRPGDPGQAQAQARRCTATSTARPWSPRPDAPSIYDIPKVLHREGLDAYVVRRLGLSFRDVDWTRWDDLLERVHHPKHDGHGRDRRQVRRPARRVPVGHRGGPRGRVRAPRPGRRSAGYPATSASAPTGAAAALSGVDGVVIPGGFGVRGIEGKIGAVRYARENGIPTLGLCLGLQCMTIEVARHLAGLDGANSLEFDENAAAPGHRDDGRPDRHRGRQGRPGRHDAARRLPGRADRGLDRRRGVRQDRGRRAAPAPVRGEQRLPGRADQGRAARSPVPRRTAGWSSSSSWTGTLHPYFVATQAHPELKSRPTRSHPLFAGLVGAALAYNDADRLPVDGRRRASARAAVGAGRSDAVRPRVCRSAASTSASPGRLLAS